MSLLSAACIIWCLSDCRALSWDAVPDPDTDHYLVRSNGLIVATVPADAPVLQYVLPALGEPTDFNVVAVDAGGRESENPIHILVEPGIPERYMELNCRDHGCKQWARRKNPERVHLCEMDNIPVNER